MAPVCGLALALVAFPSLATTIVVNSTADVIANDGNCTLREAVIAANTNSPSGGAAGECPAGTASDVINLQAAIYNLTIAGVGEDNAQTGDLDILERMTIVGVDAESTVVYGSDLDRVFDVHNSVSGPVVIRDLAIDHGLTTGSGGGVRNRANLTLRRVTTDKHVANLGGVIFSDDTLILEDCTIAGALSDDDGAGLYLAAGSTTTITRCRIFDNEAGGTGGGIYNLGLLQIIESTIELNTSAWGGGIHNAGGNLTLTQSAIGQNIARRYGGGMAVEGSTATITNSTIAQNRATERAGNISALTGGNITLVNATVANGNSPTPTAIRNDGAVAATNTIISGSCGGNSINSNGGNLESPGNSCNFNQASDKSNVTTANLDIYPFTSYGGTTMVNVVGPNSVAIDGALNGPCPPIDQRGSSRPRDGDDNGSTLCDVGAYEADNPIFIDDFESGNTGNWSSTETP